MTEPPALENASPLRLDSGSIVAAANDDVPAVAAGAAPPDPATRNRAARPESEPAAATVRVDLERVDRLVNLVGELVINQAMLAQSVT